MTKKKIGSLSRPNDLRWQAEEIARGKVSQLSENLDTLSPEEQRQLLHELRVQQIELEMQNESLRRTQEELESSRVRYFNLYDLAPVGYFTLSEEGLILEANLTASSLMGVARSTLVKKLLTRFIFREDQDIYYHHCQQLFEIGTPQVCELRLVKKDGSLSWVRLESTVAQDSENGDVLCRTVIIDIYKYKQAEESLRKSEEELKLSYQKLKKAMKSTIQAIALILEKKDPYTAGHQKRVTTLACAIAEEIGLFPDKIERLYMAGMLHDIGKINVPTEILSKPGRLSEIEFSLIKTHPQTADDILKEMELPWEVSSTVLQHHERMDGSGYPSGLSGEAILLEARILAVADVVEAMASYRPYRSALGIDKALEEITKNKGKLYDPEVVDACLKLFKKKGFKLE